MICLRYYFIFPWSGWLSARVDGAELNTNSCQPSPLKPKPCPFWHFIRMLSLYFPYLYVIFTIKCGGVHGLKGDKNLITICGRQFSVVLCDNQEIYRISKSNLLQEAHQTRTTHSNPLLATIHLLTDDIRIKLDEWNCPSVGQTVLRLSLWAGWW